MLSDEQRARRFENIERGVVAAQAEETDSMPHRGMQTEPELLSPSLDDDDGHSTIIPTFSFRMNARPCTPPPRSGPSTINELPTPSSPTSYTRGGQRALSRASENGSVDSISTIGKGKQRMVYQDDTISAGSSTLATTLDSTDGASTVVEGSGQEANMDVETEPKESSVRLPFLRELYNFLIASVSVPEQIESTGLGSKPKAEGQVSNLDRASLFAKAVETMENTQKNMDSLHAILQEMGQKELTYQRNLEALEKQLQTKDEFIKELQQKNALSVVATVLVAIPISYLFIKFDAEEFRVSIYLTSIKRKC